MMVKVLVASFFKEIAIAAAFSEFKVLLKSHSTSSSFPKVSMLKIAVLYCCDMMEGECPLVHVSCV